MKIEENSDWLYVGPPPGRNLVHRVVMRYKDKKTSKIEVITWSIFDKDPKNGGYSWLGSETEFLENFQPASFA